MPVRVDEVGIGYVTPRNISVSFAPSVVKMAASSSVVQIALLV